MFDEMLDRRELEAKAAIEAFALHRVYEAGIAALTIENRPLQLTGPEEDVIDG